jgi:ribosome maturation protein Sdo1
LNKKAYNKSPVVMEAVTDALIHAVEEKHGRIPVGETAIAVFPDAVVEMKREEDKSFSIVIKVGKVFRVGHKLSEALEMADTALDDTVKEIPITHKQAKEILEILTKGKEK